MQQVNKPLLVKSATYFSPNEIINPEEECYNSKHVDHAVIYIHVYIINLIQQSSTTSVVELGIQIPLLFLKL